MVLVESMSAMMRPGLFRSFSRMMCVFAFSRYPAAVLYLQILCFPSLLMYNCAGAGEEERERDDSTSAPKLLGKGVSRARLEKAPGGG